MYIHICIYMYIPCRLIWCSVGWLVDSCGARAALDRVSTYFIYMKYKSQTMCKTRFGSQGGFKMIFKSPKIS